MATKRKVGNLLALAVLSVIIERPMHRYEIASTLRDRGKDRDMDIKWGSLYTVVQNMAKAGFLEVVGCEREGARPERVIYRITHPVILWLPNSGRVCECGHGPRRFPEFGG
ncbi:PadR family transcriptional regulator, partial [Nocardia cyriacigeorgica]|uniref:PadR family transcriptional regulator n=1 Tax=Nocardia cyriacigeorgica TaxID=135487 RepID=UPI002458821B